MKLKAHYTQQLYDDLYKIFYDITKEDILIAFYLKWLWKIDLPLKEIHHIREKFSISETAQYYSKHLMKSLGIPRRYI
jgi:hypothetical protein